MANVRVEDKGLNQKWILDSGASRHIKNNLTNLMTMVLVDGMHRTVRIENVAFVLDLKTNLLSVSELRKKCC